MTDTVGFIQKLPTSLVAAFRATLEEVIEADILLEVVDITHENAIEQSETVNAVLAELGAADKPRVTALNKIDLLPNPAEVDTALWPNAVPVSALTGQGIPELLRRVGEVIAAQLVPVRVVVPFARGDLVEVFHRRGHVTEERHEPEGTLLVGSMPPALLSLFAPFYAPARPAPRKPRGTAASPPAEPERAAQAGGE